MEKKLRLTTEEIPVGRGVPISLTVQEDEIRPENVESIHLSRVDIEGSVQSIDVDFLFEGKIIGYYTLNCDRCVEPTEAQVSLDLTWLFSEPGHLETDTDVAVEEIDILEEDENSEILYVHDDIIDLAAPIWEELVMAKPSKVHCREDCKGLCPHCGKNLNDGACSCAENAPGSGGAFDGLKELLPNLPSDSATADDR